MRLDEFFAKSNPSNVLHTLDRIYFDLTLLFCKDNRVAHSGWGGNFGELNHKTFLNIFKHFPAVYRLCSMAVVALTVISSVVVTNIYQNNISDCVRSLLQRCKTETETTVARPAGNDDPDGKGKVQKRETFDMEKYCKELSLRVDRVLFYIWLTIYIFCSLICLFMISL